MFNNRLGKSSLTDEMNKIDQSYIKNILLNE